MILIVDSEKIPESKVQHKFQEYGFEHVEVAKTVGNARLLLEKYNENITLIIIESELDKTSGYEFCREIKKSDYARNAYIMLLVSSSENKTAIEKAKHSGANGYSVKPYFSAPFQKNFFKYMISKVVLIIEDDPVIRQLVKSIIAKSHVEVIEVEDGILANNLLNKILPSRLVIMDIGLPNMNGIQLVQNIRNKASWRKTFVVMLTGSSDTENVKACLAAGANDYLTKPINIESFTKRLSRFLPDEN